MKMLYLQILIENNCCSSASRILLVQFIVCKVDDILSHGILALIKDFLFPLIQVLRNPFQPVKVFGIHRTGCGEHLMSENCHLYISINKLTYTMNRAIISLKAHSCWRQKFISFCCCIVYISCFHVI